MPAGMALWFTGPRTLELRPHSPPLLSPGNVLVQAQLSAISPGTELLFYRGQIPQGLELDSSIAALSGETQYPLQYGYCLAGHVVETGPGVDPAWLNQCVFAFQSHQSLFSTPVEALFPIPEDIPFEDAVFLPNMETAANLVMDAAPLLGERVAVFGQGIVGLLTTALLARFPLNSLVTVDRYARRQAASLNLGANACIAPVHLDAVKEIRLALKGDADLSLEISGAPQALNQAIQVTGFGGRVVIGSWYGSKAVNLDLGGEFHRSRIRLISSQVSTIDPALSGRWTKARRFELTWDLLRQIKPSRWITHTFPFGEAAIAYALLDEQPGEAIQVLLKY